MTGRRMEELFTLRSETPKPGDFDAYWDRALAQLDEVFPCAELRPAGPEIPGFRCAELWFTGIGGARIHARCVLPRDAKRHPAVLHFHGYRWHCADFSQLLPFAAAGCAVFAMSCRGQGGPSQDNAAVDGPTYNGHIFRGILDAPDKLLYRQIFLDTVQLARAAAALPEVDGDRIGVVGGSQGGGLALACAALEPRVQRAAVWYPFLCDYRRGWRLSAPESAYFELRGLFRNVDPRHEREEELFTRLGYVAVEHLAPRIRAHVRMATALCDIAVPVEAQMCAYNAITADKHLDVYPDFGHEELPGFSDIVLEEMLKL